MNIKWRIFLICTGVFSAAHAVRAIISPIIPHLRDFFFLNYFQTSVLFSAYDIGFVVGLFGMFFLGEYLDKRKMVILAPTFLFFTSIYSALSPSFQHLFVSRFIGGIGFSFYFAFGIALIAEYFRKEEAGKMMGFHSVGSAVGRLYGAVMSGTLATLFGWQYSFYGMAAISGMFALFALLGLKSPTQTKPKRTGPPAWRRLIDKRLLLTTFIYSLTILYLLASMSFFPLFLSKVGSLNADVIGYLLGLITIVTVIANPIIGTASDRFGKVRITMFLFLLSALLSAILPFLRGLLAFTLFALALGLVVSSTIQIFIAFITQITVSETRSSALGLFNGTGFLLGLIFLNMLGFMADLIGIEGIFYLLSAFMLGGVPMSWKIFGMTK